MHNRRLVAYVLDLVILTLFLSICFLFFPKEKKMKEIQAQVDTLSAQYTEGQISVPYYFMEMSRLEKQRSERQTFKIIINGIGIVIYYTIVPLFLHGATFGMKLMHLKIVSNENKNILLVLFFRTLLLDGLLSTILLLLGIYMISGKFYLSFISVLVILQLLTLLASYFMVKCRSDKAGLCDFLSHSKVVALS